MNPIIELDVWGNPLQEQIEKIMKKAGYFLLNEGSLTHVWALKKYAKCVEDVA